MLNYRHAPGSILRNMSFALTITAGVALSPITVPTAFASTGGHLNSLNPPVYCHTGQGYSRWSKTAKPWKVLHELAYEHFVHGKGSYTEKVKEVASIEASVKFDEGGQATFGIDEVASLGAHVGLSLEAKGKRTDTHSIIIKQELTDYATYIFYDGTRHATGTLLHYICHQETSFVRNGKAVVTSWEEPTVGVLDCKTKPPKRSLGATVKKLYC
jgi:hypothetical protein